MACPGALKTMPSQTEAASGTGRKYPAGQAFRVNVAQTPNFGAPLFAKGCVRQLEVPIQNYEKQIGSIAQQHPDFPIVSSFPGIGKTLAPRLIAELGTHCERFPDPKSIKSYSGIAPVREASGRRERVHARWAGRSSSNKPFRNGHNIPWLFVPGRADTTMNSEAPAKVTSREFAVDSHSLPVLAGSNDLRRDRVLRKLGSAIGPCEH